STWKYDGTTFSINRGADVLFTMQITLPVSGFYQFEGITIDSKNQRLFTLYYTDANGQIQNVTGSFNEQIDFSCCGYQKNIVPVFCLRKQISRGFVSGDPNLNGKLFYSDRIFTPKNISIPQQQGFTMEFSVDKRDKGADPFTMSDWQPEIKIDSNPYDVYFEQLTNGVNAYAYVHYPPKNRLSWNGYYGARYDITRLEYNINGNEKVFEFKERAGTFTKSTDGTGSLSMNITSNSSIWNPTGGLSLNTTNETYWDNTDPGFILDFNQKTKLTFKATLKFTGDLPYYNGLKGGKEGYFGHIAQLDYQDPINGDLYQLLVYGKNQTAELCTTCIPQTVAPVVCDEKYATYLAFLNFNSVGVSTRFPAVSREDVEEEEEFCRKNLGYLVDSYIVYCKNATINITSTESPRYLTLTQFGVTNLNYGYTKINDAITAYATYLSSPVGPDPKYPDDEPLVHLGWGEYVDTKYITDNKICAPPAPMLVNSLEIMAGPSPCEQMNITLSETYQDDAYNAYL
ncbi:MAG: hypothetical protein H7329_13755, partial [Opitutaceae bacterium]|nr:hypothetical protein [Cytophagales bacterium]